MEMRFNGFAELTNAEYINTNGGDGGASVSVIFVAVGAAVGFVAAVGTVCKNSFSAGRQFMSDVKNKLFS